MAFAPFVHLRVQSSYSMLEGAVQPAELVKRVAKARMPALALVDRNNLFGAMEFSDYASGAGVQPIIGVTLAIARPQAGEAPFRDPTDHRRHHRCRTPRPARAAGQAHR